MLYNYYLEGYSGGALVKQYLEGYKSKVAIESARIRFCESHKVALVGQCLYSFTGDQSNKYNRDQYTIIDQFNCKPYFEYWS